MARGGRDLFRVDYRLRIRMGLALLASLALTLGMFAALMLAVVEIGMIVVVFVIVLLLGGAVAAHADPPEPETAEEEARVEVAARRLDAVVSRLAAVADMCAPTVEVTYDRAPLCWTTATVWNEKRVHATLGLVELLPNDELAAVVAHELGHVARNDTYAMSVVGGPPTWTLRGYAASLDDAD